MLLIFLSVAFVVTGSEEALTSYVELPVWSAKLGSSLNFNFRTSSQNGLILYQEDTRNNRFLELKLVEGVLRLRYSLGNGSQLVQAGRNLHDNRIYSVELRRLSEKFFLIYLNTSAVGDIRVPRNDPRVNIFHHHHGALFFGSVPGWYRAKVGRLVLPTATYEPPFRGSIKGVAYEDSNGIVQQVTVLPLQGAEASASSSCLIRSPCFHDSICYETDEGPACHCLSQEFVGRYCEKRKRPMEASLKGTELIIFDPTQGGIEPMITTQDEISFMMKTRKASGAILLAGSSRENYIYLGLSRGTIQIIYRRDGENVIDNNIKPLSIDLDNGHYHTIRLQRRSDEITLSIDGYSTYWPLKESRVYMTSSRIYIGAMHNAEYEFVREIDSFVGCLKKLTFKADGMELNILEMAQSRSDLTAVSGHIDWRCIAEPPSLKVRDVSKFSSDELIVSGNGPECNNFHDLDSECLPGKHPSDELITPHIVFRQPPQTPRYIRPTPSSNRGFDVPCDDEECGEGSGREDNDREPYGPGKSIRTTTNRPPTRPSTKATSRAATLNKRFWLLDEFTSSTPKPVTTIAAQRIYPGGGGIGGVDMYKPIVKRPNQEELEKIRERISSDAEESTALVIGIIAGILIAIILVAILVLKLKQHSERKEKFEERPRSWSLKKSEISSTKSSGSDQQLDVKGKKSSPTSKSGKHLKEWYV
ncbi:neurexin 1-like [Artemia franciscana]|uniref:Uncharacterized protein n=1 Tax=Artemia franciscana TaxID=6661 RepID=A0AA88KYK8_ARTSF|nr:hypothetical protein QYM36_014645 [Artemia franciscana]